MTIKTNKELVAACKDVAQNYKTLYVLGGIGMPMNATNKARVKRSYAYNAKPERAAKIDAASADTFGFDCVCLVKSLLWGWCGDASKNYGGAVYQSNGVPDISETAMMNACTDVSDDFSKIPLGAYLWMKGHCGIYIGNGLAVECTPIWKDGVQITAVHNIGKKSGYNGRSWTKYGKLPYITYEAEPIEPEQPVVTESDYTLGFRYLRKGCQGEDVEALQLMLKGRGYNLGSFGPNKDGIDGDFGNATFRSVVDVQHNAGLEEDGVVGADTMSCLLGLK